MFVVFVAFIYILLINAKKGDFMNYLIQDPYTYIIILILSVCTLEVSSFHMALV